jgi:hypothetical protein
MARNASDSNWPPLRLGQWLPKTAHVRAAAVVVLKLTWTISRVACRRITT